MEDNGSIVRLQHITLMPKYSSQSPEELRWQHYMVGSAISSCCFTASPAYGWVV